MNMAFNSRVNAWSRVVNGWKSKDGMGGGTGGNAMES